MAADEHEITKLLRDWSEGNREALDRLTGLVYRELHQLAVTHMAQERQGHTLQPTALIDEAYARLLRGSGYEWQSRGHFFAFAAKVMRQVLVDHGRRRAAAKRAPANIAFTPQNAAASRPVDLLDLDLALQRLEEFDPRKARILEHHYFAGLGVLETSKVMGISESTVRRDLRLAEAWLLRELSGDPPEDA